MSKRKATATKDPGGPVRVTLQWTTETQGVAWLMPETAAALHEALNDVPVVSFEAVIRKGLSRVKAERRFAERRG